MKLVLKGKDGERIELELEGKNDIRIRIVTKNDKVTMLSMDIYSLSIATTALANQALLEL